MSGRAKKRKNAGEGYGYMFHGSFGTKAKAVAKERKTKGAWVKGVLTNKGHRYLVMSPRTNPIRRKRHNPGDVDRQLQLLQKELDLELYLEQQAGHEVAQWSQSDARGASRGRRSAEKHVRKHAKQAARIRKLIDKLQSKYGRNPHELLVLGANPHTEHADIEHSHGSGHQEITVPPGSTITIRMNPTEARQNVELGTFENGVFHPWTRRPKSRQKEAIRRQNPGNPDRFTSAHAIAKGISCQAPGLIQTKRQRRVAGMVRSGRKHKYDWIPPEGIAPGQNPSAAGIREDFTGMPVDRETVRHEPHMPAGDYAKLGKLLILYVKPRTGGQVLEIRPAGVIAVSDESARQIWFVGGDQDVTAALAQFGALDRGAGLFELGEARRIDYEQRKEHVKDPDQDHWRHEFGEETDERPTVLFDRTHKRLLLEGGAYEIRREGIVN